MMDCREFQLAWVSDDPTEQGAARRHASGCPRCAETVHADGVLMDAVARWKERADAPPERIGRQIARTLSDEGLIHPAPTGESPGRASRSLAGYGTWVAAAAVLILGVAILLRGPWREREGDSYAEAVRRVEQAQQDYTRAIAGLERRADEILARADDPALESRDAALLLNYRDRLTHLDSVIAEVQSFLDGHPGHSQGHVVLLAAYEEKDQLLREILRLSPGERS